MLDVVDGQPDPRMVARNESGDPPESENIPHGGHSAPLEGADGIRGIGDRPGKVPLARHFSLAVADGRRTDVPRCGKYHELLPAVSRSGSFSARPGSGGGDARRSGFRSPSIPWGPGLQPFHPQKASSSCRATS